jgi:ABC-type maltose transport system permease subunit
MNISETSYSLLFWILFNLISLILTTIALFQLLNNHTIDSRTKLSWTLAIIFIPIVGVIAFFRINKRYSTHLPEEKSC